MLDVHVLTYQSEPKLLDSCLASIGIAAARAPFPVSIHVCPGHAGHIGLARQRAYELGNYPYVTCVDDDDWIEPTAFTALFDALRAGASAIYSRSNGWQNGMRVNLDHRQHLRVFKRSCLASFDFEAWPACDSTALMAHFDATADDAVYLDERLYHHRIDPWSRARQILYADSELQKRVHALGNVHKWLERVA